MLDLSRMRCLIVVVARSGQEGIIYSPKRRISSALWRLDAAADEPCAGRAADKGP